MVQKIIIVRYIILYGGPDNYSNNLFVRKLHVSTIFHPLSRYYTAKKPLKVKAVYIETFSTLLYNYKYVCKT